MARKIQRSFRRTRISLFSLYGKALTLLFALFCVASGQLIQAAPAKGTATGRALFASDSTPLGTIKLYLCDIPIMVDYGPSSVPIFHKKDSVFSDKDGYFTTSDSIPSCYCIVAESVKKTSGAIPMTYVSNNSYQPKTNDTVTVYMQPRYPATAVQNGHADAIARPLYSIRGKTVTVRIPEWTNGIHGASVADVQGTIIARLRAQPNGDIRWNAESAASGIYFLDISNGKNHLTMKIAIR